MCRFLLFFVSIGFLFFNYNLTAQSLNEDLADVTINSSFPPSADFESDLTSSCVGTIQFKDLSSNTPVSWLWQFGDGGLSTDQYPIYTYVNSGTYTVTLYVTNSLGVDTLIKTNYISIEKPNINTAINAETCINSTATLSATNGTGTLRWYDGANTLVHTGATFTTPNLVASSTYFVEDVLQTTLIDFAGPKDAATVGNGGYHGSGFTGGVNFTAAKAFDVISVWVDADGTADRTIYLYDGFVASGQGGVNNTVLDQITVNIPDGKSRVQLNFTVPAAGDYCLGGNQMDLFRNNGAANYPYSLAGVLDMVSSTTTSNGYYYYFYDWEIGLNTECVSARVPVIASVVNADFSAVVNGGAATFTDISTGATSWLWDFGDGNTSTVQNPIHTYSSNGPHFVTLSINNGTCTFSDSVSLSVGIEKIAENMTLSIFPNPASLETTLSFSQNLPEALSLELFSTEGKILMKKRMKTGDTSITLDLHELSPSMYYIRLFTNEINDVRKIMVR